MKLDRTFKTGLRDALVDDVMDKTANERDNWVHKTIQEAHHHLRRWGDEVGYNVEPVIESLQTPEVTRKANGVNIRWGWEHEAAVYFEFGTSPHTIDGKPVLSFVWEEDVPRWVKKEFDREGDGYRVFFGSVDVAGVKETRYIRHSLRWLKDELSN